MPKSLITAALAAVLASSPSPAQMELDPSSLICAGTEPFWTLTLDADSMRYTQMDAEDPVTFSAGPAYQSLNRADRWVRYGVTARGDLVTAVILASAGCTDLMSEIDYPADVVIIGIGERVLAGCCRPPE